MDAVQAPGTSHLHGQQEYPEQSRHDVGEEQIGVDGVPQATQLPEIRGKDRLYIGIAGSYMAGHTLHSLVVGEDNQRQRERDQA